MKQVIVAGYLIDGIHEEVKSNQYIYLKNEKIEYVTSNKIKNHDDYIVIDGKNQCVIPGLVDCHKHLFNNGGSSVGYGISLSQIIRNMKANLLGGVTSILDLGGPSIIRHLHKIPSKYKPRIFYAGPIITCDKGYPIEYMDKKFYKTKSVIECKTKQDITDTVSYAHSTGASVIKTAVVSRTFDGKYQVPWQPEMLKHLVFESHKRNMKVCAHITYADDYELATECGIDSFHHSSFTPMNEEFNKRMAKSGIFVPTLSALDLMIQGMESKIVYQKDFNPPVSKKIKEHLVTFTENYHKAEDDEKIDGLFVSMKKSELKQSQKTQIENLKSYLSYGGEIAVGTDAALGFSFHGCPTQEMILLSYAGLTISQVIKAATYNSAKVFGQENEIGSIEPGKLADILIVKKELLEDIKHIEKPLRIILNGKVVK